MVWRLPRLARGQCSAPARGVSGCRARHAHLPWTRRSKTPTCRRPRRSGRRCPRHRGLTGLRPAGAPAVESGVGQVSHPGQPSLPAPERPRPHHLSQMSGETTRWSRLVECGRPSSRRTAGSWSVARSGLGSRWATSVCRETPRHLAIWHGEPRAACRKVIRWTRVRR